MSYCTKCGRESKSGAYCAQCGSALEVIAEQKAVKAPSALATKNEFPTYVDEKQPETNNALRNSLIAIVLVAIVIGVITAVSLNRAAENERSQAIADRQAATELAARQSEQEKRRLEAVACKNYRAVFDSNPLGQAIGSDQAVAIEALTLYGSAIRQAVNDAYDVRVAGNNLADALTTVATELQLTGTVTPSTLANVDTFDKNLTRICGDLIN